MAGAAPHYLDQAWSFISTTTSHHPTRLPDLPASYEPDDPRALARFGVDDGDW